MAFLGTKNGKIGFVPTEYGSIKIVIFADIENIFSEYA